MPVKGAKTRIPEETLALPQGQRSSCAGHNARAEIGIGLCAQTEIQRYAGMRKVAKIEETALVIAPRVAKVEGADVTVFDFVLIARRRAKPRKQVTRLRVETAAIVLIGSDKGEIAGNRGDRGR